MMKNKQFFTLIIFSLFCSNLFAEKIYFSAASMKGKTSENSEETILEGSAYIKTETMEIKAERIELSGEDYRYIKATGEVTGSNSESKMDFSCDSLSFDRQTKIASLEGNVNLVDIENEVRAQAQIIEYNQETEIAILQIKINLTQKDNVCSGAYAIYKKKDQFLEINGNAQVRKGDDTFRAQLITLDMKTEDITLDGNVKGSIKETTKAKKRPAEEEKEKETSGQN